MSQQKQHSQRSKRSAVVKSEPKQMAGHQPQLPRPTTEEEWHAHWKAQNQPWRTEPEISLDRQEELRERQTIVPDIEKGIYPFGTMKLDRADVEWLLATHESSGIHGPVEWKDASQRQREGMDLRGADLRQANLTGLPLARMRGGLARGEWSGRNKKELSLAAVHMEEVNLTEAELQGAILRRAELQGAILFQAHLQDAELRQTQLQRADLKGAQLQGANLCLADIERADLYNAQLQGANLNQAGLQGAVLTKAQLQGADLRGAELEHAGMSQIVLSDEKYGIARLADVKWGNTNLAVVDWSQVSILGDEHVARQKTSDGDKKLREEHLGEYQDAVRANRQLAVALRNQGLNEEADRFAYRAQICQRTVLLRQGWRSWAKWLGSWFLALLAGYGYRPMRTILWYLFIIGGFTIAYSVIGSLPLLPDALVFSVMSFHGRGFFPSLSGETSLHNPVVILAAAEAVIGLLIEVSFIATFTQRFFGR